MLTEYTNMIKKLTAKTLKHMNMDQQKPKQ